MLTYGGMGLLLAGVIMMFFSGKLIQDPAKAANAKKQAPILAIVGAVMLGIAAYLGGAFG